MVLAEIVRELQILFTKQIPNKLSKNQGSEPPKQLKQGESDGTRTN